MALMRKRSEDNNHNSNSNGKEKEKGRNNQQQQQIIELEYHMVCPSFYFFMGFQKYPIFVIVL
jgi:hypothetical protein